jgi:hypothetical protein
VVIHRLSPAEQRVLSSFLSGRLPAGQVYTQLERARMAPPQRATAAAQPAVQPVPAVAA